MTIHHETVINKNIYRCNYSGQTLSNIVTKSPFLRCYYNNGLLFKKFLCQLLLIWGICIVHNRQNSLNKRFLNILSVLLKKTVDNVPIICLNAIVVIQIGVGVKLLSVFIC
jgi:hypothetical protein